MIGYISACAFIGMGLKLRYSSQDGWGSLRRYWLYFVLFGFLSLFYKLYKYYIQL